MSDGVLPAGFEVFADLGLTRRALLRLLRGLALLKCMSARALGDSRLARLDRLPGVILQMRIAFILLCHRANLVPLARSRHSEYSHQVFGVSQTVTEAS